MIIMLNHTHVAAPIIGPDNATCEIPSDDKLKCGDYGISRDQCLSLDCCWYTREFEGAVPYCYCRPKYSLILNHYYIS